MLYKTYYKSPLGKITLISDENYLKRLNLEHHRFYNGFEEEKILQDDNLEILVKTKNWLDRYFKGECPKISEIPLAPDGSEFRQMVWKILCNIPYGKLTTYGNVAKQIAKQKSSKKMSAQAVGNAVGHNLIPIIIPCHRVIGTNGNLTGYGGGIQTKVKLLELEKVNMTNLYIPIKGTAL